MAQQATQSSSNVKTILSVPFKLLDPAEINNEQDVNTDELESYLQYKVATDDSIDVLDFWRSKQLRWPSIAKVVTEIFCILPTSTPSERGFSTMGRIVSKSLNRLLPETAGFLIF
jgi:hypothetical protein